MENVQNTSVKVRTIVGGEAAMVTRQVEKNNSDTCGHQKAIRVLYLEALQLVEKLHRRLLDVVKDEFERNDRPEINAVQALLLFNIGSSELTAGELRSRGFYLGSNVSYNLKKLVEFGFVNHQRSCSDKRTVLISLTQKGQEIADMVTELYERHIVSIEHIGGIGSEEFLQMNRSLQRLDRFWNDTIAYRL